MARRKLLIISHRFPYPLTRGEKIRAFNLIRHLSRDYDIFLGTIVDEASEFAHLDVIRPMCADLGAFGIDKRRQKLWAAATVRPGRPMMLDYYKQRGLHRWVDRTLAAHRIDLIYILCTAMAPYALGRVGTPKILDMGDVDSEKWADYARSSGWPMRAVWAREARTLFAYERAAALACDLTLLVTRPEAEHFAQLVPEAREKIDWVEQGVDLDAFSPAAVLASPFPGSGPNLVFVGNMDYRPNAEGAVWFAREVFPLVRAQVPAAQFWIVGGNPVEEVRALAGIDGIHLTGRVPEVQPYVAHADVSVCPLLMARGIQNKVLEAMAMARPVVATPPAYEGVRAEAGRDLLVADGAPAMARTILDVLGGNHPGLGAAAREAMERGYAWSATLARLDARLAQLLGAAESQGGSTPSR